MIDKSEIRQYTKGQTYKRGLEIYNSTSKIANFEVLKIDNRDHVHASVKGSRGNYYGVSIDIDPNLERIEGCFCSCPAFQSYDELCKHCVAVALNYIDYAKHNSKKAQKKKQEKITIKTSPQFKMLLEQEALRKALPYVANENYGNIQLIPELHFTNKSISVSWKLGNNRMYILKDVFSFVERINVGETYAYGKNLEFIHSYDAFTKEAKPMVDFICNWVSNHYSEYEEDVYRYSYDYGYVRDTKLKTLKSMPINTYELEALLNIINERDISVQTPDGHTENYHITNGEFSADLYISKLEDGLELELEGFNYIRGNKYDFQMKNRNIYRVSHEKMSPVYDFMTCMWSNDDRVYLQKDDIPAFCRNMLPQLEKVFHCKKEDFNIADYDIVDVTFELYLDTPQKDFITCKAVAVYGEQKFNIYDNVTDVGIRDIPKELEFGKVVSSYCNAYDEQEQMMVLADDEEKIYLLLTEGLSHFQEIAEVFISDKLKRINVSNSPKVEVGVSLSGNLLELKLTSDEMSMDQLIEILSAYKKKKKFYRLKNGDFINIEAESMGTLAELQEGLSITDKQLKQETIVLPKYRALYLDSELKEQQGLPVIKNKNFKSLIRNMKTVEDSDYEIPETLEKILREYQKTGFLWMKTLKNNGFCGILADDMGLGKTLQVITFLQSEMEENIENQKCLIVAPASLVFNWQSEIERFAPELSVKVIVGAVSERKALLGQLNEKDIVVTSYDLLKRDIDLYKDIIFAYQVIDEAQYIKNHNTQVARAVKTIQSNYKLALTGTPVENSLSELWSIFDYLMPGYLYSYKKFREEIELPIVQNSLETATSRLQKMIKPFVLRRLKKEVLKDLPDKIEKNMYAKLEGEQQKIYDASVKRLQLLLDKQSDEEFKNSKLQILSELTRLRQLCCNPSLVFEDYHGNSAKTELCIDLLKNAIDGGHKILLFSQFTSMLDELQKRMKEENISFYTLTGSTGKEKRRQLVEQFNHDDTSVFCISLKAGGTGLNLTAADIVIHYDPWWNLAVQNQATDRAHRIGQKNVVTVYKLIAKGTIEENIVKLQDRKKELADQILNGEEMSQGSFSKEELLELLNG